MTIEDEITQEFQGFFLDRLSSLTNRFEFWAPDRDETLQRRYAYYGNLLRDAWQHHNKNRVCA